MVAVFAEVRRVLRDDGTLWLNIGDSYAHGAPSGTAGQWNGSSPLGENRNAVASTVGQQAQGSTAVSGLKPKDLCGIPWRLAFALQADGWYLRSDIIWSKPNPMPESVTDRPTKAHEYLFLLTKSARYFFDQEAVRERWADDRLGQSYPNGAPLVQATKGNPDRNDGGHTSSARTGLTGGAYSPPGQSPHGNARGPDGRRVTGVHGADGSLQHRDGERWPNGGRNIRSVWEIATEPYPDAHFATFPQALVEPCIKAGCPVGGTVLDPFLGSGTTALVARRLGRSCVGIELNEDYARLAARRLQQLSLLAEGAA
jgi:DNA modification methylase